MSKKMKMYDEILSNDDIVKLGLIIKNFEKGFYDYKTLVYNMKEMGVDIFPVTIDLSKKKMTIKDEDEIKTRFERQQFKPDDIRYFVISSSTYSNIIIRYDISMIRVLAHYGDLDSQKHLLSVLEYQCRLLGAPSTKKQREAVQTWKAQIEYLNHQISLNNEQKNNKRK